MSKPDGKKSKDKKQQVTAPLNNAKALRTKANKAAHIARAQKQAEADARRKAQREEAAKQREAEVAKRKEHEQRMAEVEAKKQERALAKEASKAGVNPHDLLLAKQAVARQRQNNQLFERRFVQHREAYAAAHGKTSLAAAFHDVKYS